MKQFLAKFFFVLVLLKSSAVAIAHHSFSATFDEKQTITVEGVVTNFSFRNPHVLVYIDSKDKDGKVVNWMSEGSAATLMRRSGWDKDVIKEGDAVRVTGNATHDGSPMVSIESIQLLTGVGGEIAKDLSRTETGGGRQGQEIVKAAPMPLELDSGLPNLTGAWTNHGMRDGRPVPVTVAFNEAGEKLQESFKLEHDSQVFCDPPGLARQVYTPHPIIITQEDARIVFDYEEYGGRREVAIGDKIVDSGIKTHLGDSIARYENDKLIVESINLLSNQVSPEGNRLSDQISVTETYSRIDDDEYGPIILVEVEVSDPLYLTEDIKYSKRKMSAGAHYEMIENDCQPPRRERTVVSPVTSFFLTSEGVGNGANLGGLAGADAHCNALATSVGVGDRDWKAYLSTTGADGVNARDRIGAGPWYNARGVLLAKDVDHLHAAENLLTKASVISERGVMINGRGDEPNRHDVLTGSLSDGTASNVEGDTTCANWTSNGEGSALVGHHDRTGGGANPTSWNEAHGSRGCSQENLQGSGGDGLFYCFDAGVNSSTSAAVIAQPSAQPSSAASNVQAETLEVTAPSSSGGGSMVWLLLPLFVLVMRRENGKMT